MSERFWKELKEHPKPWELGSFYDEILDANGCTIDSALLLWYIQELESIREIQAKIIQGFRARVGGLFSYSRKM